MQVIFFVSINYQCIIPAAKITIFSNRKIMDFQFSASLY